MKRVQIHQSNHPFDPNPFEAFWKGSWHPVERLNINNGGIITHVVTNGSFIEKDIPISHLRIRSRKAVPSDCISFLRQGIDVCVFATPPHDSDDEDDEKKDEPGWIDGRIRSIERKPHEGECDCDFFVSLYINQGPDLLSMSKKISKEKVMMKIDQVTVLQRLEWKPSEDQYYRWGLSEDLNSVQKFRLYTGRFCTDLSWLITASVLKRTAFNIRSVKNHLVYEISEYDPDKSSQLETSAMTSRVSHMVNFKVENGLTTSVVVDVDLDSLDERSEGNELGLLESYNPSELRRSQRRNVQPERYLACDNFNYEIEVSRLGESKTFYLEYDEKTSSDDEDDDEYDGGPCVLSVQDDNNYKQLGGAERWIKSFKRKHESQSNGGDDVERKKKKKKTKHQRASVEGDKGELAIVPSQPSNENESSSNGFFNFKIPEEEEEDSKEFGAMVSKYFYMNGFATSQKKMGLDFGSTEGESVSKKGSRFMRRKYNRVRSHHSSTHMKRDCFYVRESIYDVRSFRKGSATARLCRELIRRCMNNIDLTLKKQPVPPPVIDQWKEHQSAKFSDVKEKECTETGEELSEIDMLWKEMELALASWYLMDENEDVKMKTAEEEKKSNASCGNECEHDFWLDEQIGTVCQLCGFIETKIKDILPPFVESSYSYSAPNKEEVKEEERTTEVNEVDEFCIPAPSHIPPTIGTGEKNVWELIPELKDKLLPHQTKAYEFLWTNIAGSLVPNQMESKIKSRGGCVISHSPGAGKTLLIIAFLVSYLKLFPGSRPLVLAPKTTLYTWYKEIIKWKVPIPVYQIHGGQTYKGEVLKQRMKLAPGLPRNQDVMHVLDCLEKMQMWLSHPSILLMGYTSFLTLTREDSHYAHRKYMAQLLKQCPGIVILDEGHNPRSTKSRLRKALMKVDTRLRVLLSGTLFQNNFGEYFNTLCLARPIFMNEVLKELDPKYEKRNKQRQTQFSLENRGRKLLIDKISKKIDSNKEGERAEALQTLRKLTTKFIDVYEGGSSNDRLPGLQVYTLMMKSTALQQELLLKLQNQRPIYKGFPLELELLITLGAIHPCLIRTTACSRQYFSDEELKDLERYTFDIKSGSKVRFVMSLLPGCLHRNEKLLIFCHNIAPINLFLRIFEKFYGWSKGKEVLVLQGDIELFERGRVMDKFEEPGGPSKVMLASITACAEGISLTAASRVILLDSEWNPSKSKQAVARAFRPGQNKVVYVYQLLATGTLEEEKHSRTTWKEWVSDMIFSDESVEDPSHWQAAKIEDELLREIVEEDRAALFHKIMKNEKASNVIRGKDMLKQM